MAERQIETGQDLERMHVLSYGERQKTQDEAARREICRLGACGLVIKVSSAKASVGFLHA